MRVIARAVVSLGVVFAAIAGCSDGTHVFLARAWSQSSQCLGALQAIDTMRGTDYRADCPPRCYRNAYDPTLFYVSGMCETAAPPLTEIASADETCARATLAWTTQALCDRDASLAFDAGQDAVVTPDADATVATDVTDADSATEQ